MEDVTEAVPIPDVRKRSDSVKDPTRWTPNEIVGYRMRVVRIRRGWSQRKAREELARYGLDWSEAVYSAAERSEVAPGGRIRQFDANEILALAAAFSVSPSWFFLPSGRATRIAHPDAPRGGGLSIGDFLEIVLRGGRRMVEVDLYDLARAHRPDLVSEDEAAFEREVSGIWEDYTKTESDLADLGARLSEFIEMRGPRRGK